MKNILISLIFIFTISNLNAKNYYSIIDNSGEIIHEKNIFLNNDYIECIKADICLSIFIKNRNYKYNIEEIIKNYQTNRKIINFRKNENNNDFYMQSITHKNELISINFIRIFFTEENLLFINYSKTFHELKSSDDISEWIILNSIHIESKIMNLKFSKK
jgi:hypothetical protein